jgi:hypothetical protein
MILHVPCSKGHYVVAGPGQRFRRDRQLQLLAAASDEIRLHVDLILGGPDIDLLEHDLVAFRHPMILKSDRQFTGGAGGAQMDQGQGCSDGIQLQCGPAIHFSCFGR